MDCSTETASVPQAAQIVKSMVATKPITGKYAAPNFIPHVH